MLGKVRQAGITSTDGQHPQADVELPEAQAGLQEAQAHHKRPH